MKKVIKDLSLTTMKDERVISAIVNHPFKFVVDRIREKNSRPIRLRYFGVFYLKELNFIYNKALLKMELLLSDKYLNDTLLYFNTSDYDKCKSIMLEHINNKKYRIIKDAYKKVINKI